MRICSLLRCVVLTALGTPLGCVVTHRIDLTYPPGEPPPGFREDEASELAGIQVWVQPFGDRRKEPSSLGGESYIISKDCMGTNYGYRRLRTDDDVPRWVTRALEHDLKRAGYSVATSGDDGTGASGIVVEGEVIRVDCASIGGGTSAQSSVVLCIRARRGNEVIVDQWFQGRVAPLGWSRRLALALSEANSAFLRQLKDRTRVKK